jgi:lysophospholipase L1-like esterase
MISRSISLRTFAGVAFSGVVLFGGVMTADAQEADSIPPLRPGERIIFLGDSITQAGAGPGGYVTLVKDALEARKKDLRIEVIGAGISGNRVPDLEKRLDRDVLSKKPTLVVIYIGINDVWHSLQGKGTPKEEFEEGLKRIISQIQKAGARVAVCTASVIGERHDGANQLDPLLEEYCEISRKVARETHAQLVDLRKLFLTHLKEHNAKNSNKNLLTTDGVHLNAAGNQFVAERMLEALGEKGSAAPVKPARLLRHVVIFKFKDEVTKEQVQEVVDAFASLPSKISEIHEFEWGTDVSVENLANGFTHCFLVTFRDEASRAAYLPHPAHQDFVKLVGPRVDKVLVVDYWTGK